MGIRFQLKKPKDGAWFDHSYSKRRKMYEKQIEDDQNQLGQQDINLQDA